MDTYADRGDGGTATPNPGQVHSMLDDTDVSQRVFDWCPETAARRAAADRVMLGREHWQVIHAVRGFYAEFGIAPFMALLARHMRRRTEDGKWQTVYLKTLFSDRDIEDLCRYAGIPQPHRPSCP